MAPGLPSRHGTTALHRHRRGRDVGHREDPRPAGRQGRRQRRQGVGDRRGAARARGDRAHRARGRAPRATTPRCVVVSSAIRADNPELARAAELGIPVVHRSDALAPLMDGLRPIAVAGHARQDHHHVDAGGVPDRAGPGPLVRDRRRPRRARARTPVHGDGRDLRRRGGRERPQLPQVRARGRDRPQRRAGPPRQLRLDGRDLRVLRDLRRQDRARRHAGDLRRPARAPSS